MEEPLTDRKVLEAWMENFIQHIRGSTLAIFVAHLPSYLLPRPTHICCLSWPVAGRKPKNWFCTKVEMGNLTQNIWISCTPLLKQVICQHAQKLEAQWWSFDRGRVGFIQFSRAWQEPISDYCCISVIFILGWCCWRGFSNCIDISLFKYSCWCKK